MYIGGTVISSVEFHGNMSLVIFMSKCPLACRYCHNVELLEDNTEWSLEKVISEIDSSADFLDAVVISGGEPLVQTDAVIEILKHVRKIGLKTKLDTSGIYPDKIRELLDLKLLDYVSLDVKTTFSKYRKITGANVGFNVKKSMKLINDDSNVHLELRTTYVPTLHTKKDMLNLVDEIKGDIYTIQQFRNKNVLDPALEKVEVPNPHDLRKLAEELKPYFEGQVKVKSAEMPILSFSSNDIDVITGKKTRTIRKTWKTPLKKGDRLYCYWNLVSKEKMKIFEAIVTDVEDISFSEIEGNDGLAVQEGFKNSKEMLKEFKKMYGGKIDSDEKFQIIYFEKLDIDDWKGDKIDEKAMIMKRADILFDSGKFDKSTMCYDAALRLDPNDVYLLNKQGDNLSRLGRFIDAIECYDKALEIEPDNVYILNNKAIALLNSGNINEAYKASTIAYNFTPSSPIVLYWRGFILEILGRYDQALRIYDKLIVIDGENRCRFIQQSG